MAEDVNKWLARTLVREDEGGTIGLAKGTPTLLKVRNSMTRIEETKGNLSQESHNQL